MSQPRLLQAQRKVRIDIRGQNIQWGGRAEREGDRVKLRNGVAEEKWMLV